MSTAPLLRVVIDTNVVFEGLTKQGSSAGLVIDAWLAGLIQVHISNALAYEYEDVLSRKLSETRWQELKPVLGTLLSFSQFTTIYYSWRPTSPDAGDDLVIDCAMNANAIVATYNLRDFRNARKSLGLQVMTPVELVTKLALEES
ncbi:PIN domain-containing protein [Nostocales cyanobacterium LEGE 11386]|nr:PIN domain-containing protein [Nostocales cyanobacterium LEGE 11386]